MEMTQSNKDMIRKHLVLRWVSRDNMLDELPRIFQILKNTFATKYYLGEFMVFTGRADSLHEYKSRVQVLHGRG